MTITRRTFVVGAAAGAVVSQLPPGLAIAADGSLKFLMAQDFTRIYTFVTSEYNQGQRDYLSLVNARGGVGGRMIEAEVVDHANDLPRAIEAYERAVQNGALLIDPLSTPVARALTPRVLQDKMVMVTAFSGRSDAADGSVFPYIFPMSPNYWTQAALLVDHFLKTDGDLKGKKVAMVHIDTPFGKEPLPILEALSAKLGFELQTFPYTPPGNDQSSIWPQVRRAKPDWVLFWGAGVGQTVALTEAIRNGLPLDRLASSVWISESDMDVVGRDQTVGVLKVEPCASGRDPALIQAIMAEVVKPGKGAGPEEKVGTAYYNYGVMMASLMVEGVHQAFEAAPDGPYDGTWLKAGLERIKGFEAEGLIPPTTVTPEDHQGGGMARVAAWDGEGFVPKSDWFTAYQDVVWDEIRKHSAEYGKG